MRYCTWSSRFFQTAPASSSCPTPQRVELSREPLWESEYRRSEKSTYSKCETQRVTSNNGQFLIYLLAHLVHCPPQVVEVQQDDGVPHGREGAFERVRLSLLDTCRHQR